MRGAPTALAEDLRRLAALPGLESPGRMRGIAEEFDKAAIAAEERGDVLRFAASLTTALREQQRGVDHQNRLGQAT